MSITATGPAQAVRRRRTRSLRAERAWALWGSYAALVAFVILFLTPPFHMLITSLKTSAEISAQASNPWLVRHPTLQNYIDLICAPNFQMFLYNSVKITVCVVIVTMAISILAAFSLARMRFWGSQVLATGVF
ncbi:MAG: carbohydrate ABC transporter permease, partial [Acetobacteraceae bacterium]|nr:carbohydrate ABC transporter permease [Acetobacteraceae bacterium]